MSIIRNVTIEAKKYLDQPEILLFVGARQAGKTTILKQLEKIARDSFDATYFLNLEDPEYLALLTKSPKNLFKIFNIDVSKKNIVFIDEVQYLDNPSNFLKYLFDEYAPNIKLVVSGSSAFYIDKKFKDSLAGRKKIFYVRTLSFVEFLRFRGSNLAEKNLGDLKLKDKEEMMNYYYEYIVYGGYPRVVLAGQEEKKELLREIAFSYIKKDVFESGIRRDDVFYRLFKILASQVGGLVNSSELAKTLGVSKTSIDHYLYVMQKSFHIDLVKPFYRNMRKELTKMPKVFFLDLGLRNFFMNNFDSYITRVNKGALLENAVFRQILETTMQEDIKFWRTTDQREVDFVVQEKTALEVKANLGKFKKTNYIKFVEKYPDITLKIVSLGTDKKIFNTYEVINAWDL